ncbi:PAC2 family protein [Candidatus Bathyarchaeota archaeon]|nr:PAC2 family protein [Candidatus Bathyarchaeota archaeon]
MVIRSLVKIYEMPKLRDPVLVEGLPGIGLVANLAAYHLIKTLDSRRVCDIRSPYFKPLSVAGRDGAVKYPVITLYYAYISPEAEGDLLILYGNTQPITFTGQNELAETVLDLASKLGCRTVITLGGFSTPTPSEPPRVYYAANDPDVMPKLDEMGLVKLSGRVYGAAGVLVGFAKLRGMRGICLLAEVKGVQLSPSSARRILEVLTRLLSLDIDLTGIESHLAYAEENVLPFS